MKLTIKNEFENKLFGRKEITAELEYGSAVTPKKEEVISKVAEQAKTEADKVSLKQIKQYFGEGRAQVLYHIYKDTKSLEHAETINKKKKKVEKK